MKRFAPVLLAVAIVSQANLAVAQTAGPPALRAEAGFDWKPIIVGLGAIAGVAAFNVAAIGTGALPGGFAYAAGATVPAEASVAISRVYATTSAVIGGLIGYYVSSSSK